MNAINFVHRLEPQVHVFFVEEKQQPCKAAFSNSQDFLETTHCTNYLCGIITITIKWHT